MKIENNINGTWKYLPEKAISEKDLMSTQRLILISSKNEEPIKLNENFSFKCFENQYGGEIFENHLTCFLCYVKGNIDFPVVTFTVVLCKEPFVMTTFFNLKIYNKVINYVEKWLPNFEYRLAISYNFLKDKNVNLN